MYQKSFLGGFERLDKQLWVEIGQDSSRLHCIQYLEGSAGRRERYDIPVPPIPIRTPEMRLPYCKQTTPIVTT
jgi:hypothetical protein